MVHAAHSSYLMLANYWHCHILWVVADNCEQPHRRHSGSDSLFPAPSASVRTQTHLRRALSWPTRCRDLSFSLLAISLHLLTQASRVPNVWLWWKVLGWRFQQISRAVVINPRRTLGLLQTRTVRYHSQPEEGLPKLCASAVCSNHTDRLWISGLIQHGEKETNTLITYLSWGKRHIFFGFLLRVPSLGIGKEPPLTFCNFR